MPTRSRVYADEHAPLRQDNTSQPVQTRQSEQNTAHDPDANNAETAITNRPERASDRVIGLQRTVGNRSTIQRLNGGQIMRNAPGRVNRKARNVVQRFEGSEHVALGNATGQSFPAGALFPGAPELSYGEVVALAGDFYGTFDNLASPYYVLNDGDRLQTMGADPERLDSGGDAAHQAESRRRKIAELNALKRLFQIEHGGLENGNEALLTQLNNAYVTDPATGEQLPGYDVLTGGRFISLAAANYDHFSEGGANANRWKTEHMGALANAYQAGITGDQALMQRAFMQNAFGAHFLTDMFASGHMRTPRQSCDRYYRALLRGIGPTLMRNIIDHVPENINFNIPLSRLRDILPDWAQAVPLPDDYQVNLPLPFRSVIQPTLTGWATELDPALNYVGMVVGGLVSKWLHDEDNANGVRVRNQFAEWSAYGDAHLADHAADAQINDQQARMAVQVDRTEIDRMYELGQQRRASQPNAGGGAPNGNAAPNGAGNGANGNAAGNGAAPTNEPMASAVFFSFDRPQEGSGAIRAQDRPGLDRFANYLATNEGVRTTLRGWADSRGDPAYNTGLAGRRNSAVAAYLQAHGVAPEKITQESIGEPQRETTDANHAQSRRVDLIVTGNPTPPAPLTPDEQVASSGQTIELPDQVKGPYAAEPYVPEVLANQPPQSAYQWNQLDSSKKQEFAAFLRPQAVSKVSGIALQYEQQLMDAIPENISREISIDLPLIGRRSVSLSIPVRQYVLPYIQRGAGGLNSYIQPAITSALTDENVIGLLDGASALGAAAVGEGAQEEMQPQPTP